MKKLLALILALTMVLCLAACGGGGDDKTPSDGNTPSGNTPGGNTPSDGTPSGNTPGGNTPSDGTPEKVSLKVWVPEEEKPTMEKLIENFKAAHPEYDMTFDISITGIDEANSLLKTDADSAADIFQLASGGIPELSTKGLLLPIVYTDEEKATFLDRAMASVTASDGLQYAVPFTSNTFFMFYDKTMFTEEEVKSLDTMLAKDIEGVDVNVSFPVSGTWYIESFFYGTGCTLFGPDGTDPTSCDWNSENGYLAGKYVIDLINNPKFHDDKDGYAMSLLRDHKVGAIFNGTWSVADKGSSPGIKSTMGDDRYACAPLPTFTVNGKEYQMQNFGDYKTYAVKSNTAYPKAAQEFCKYIGSPEAQLMRYQDQGVGPCVHAAEDPSMATDPAIQALNTQSVICVDQPNIPEMNNYWSVAQALVDGLCNKTTTEANLQNELDKFVQGVTTGGLGG